jgi:HlyD family secretion protein
MTMARTRRPSPTSPRSSLRRGGFSWLGVAGLLAVVAGGATWFYLSLGSEPASDDPFERPARRGPFVHELVEMGELLSSDVVEVKCEVKSRGSQGVAILWLLEEGTFVTKDQELAKLDSSHLEAERQQQIITVNSAQAAVTSARNTLTSARIALNEYLEGTFAQEVQIIQSERLVAEENLRRAQDYFEYSKQLFERQYITADQFAADKFAVEKAQMELATAETKLRTLQRYTRNKMVSQLQADIDTAAAQLRAVESSYQVELQKLHEIEDQIAKCTIRAPSDGELVYANETDRYGNNEAVIEQGAYVREMQTLFRIPNPQRMQARVKVNESKIAFVQVGMPATIQLTGRLGTVLQGRVTRVARGPVQSRWSGSNVKQYYTYVEVEQPPPHLRTGLTCQVKLLVEQRADALQVPVYAVREIGGKHYCVVRANDQRQLREVQIGPTNDQMVVIEQGLGDGELVVENIARHFTDADLRRMAGVSDEPARRGPPQPGQRDSRGVARRGAPGGRAAVTEAD